ncbi:MAG: hypothetical protein AAGA02_00930 [Bacteroidota bacterium]
MRKFFVVVALIPISTALVWMVYYSVKKINSNSKIDLAQNQLSRLFSSLDLAIENVNDPAIIVYFNSECEHCQSEIKSIVKKINSFESHQLFFISHEPQTQALEFLKNYNLEENYIISNPEKVMNAFSGGVPQTLIYSNGLLKKHFKGEVSVEAVLNAINDD